MKYEYLFFKINSEADEKKVEKVLNEMGNKGWELVSVVDCPFNIPIPRLRWHTVYFKRNKNG